MKRPRIVFAGTPEFAEQILRSLLGCPSFEVVAVYTQPDRPSGRGRHLQASPVKQLGSAHGVPVYQPSSLRDAQARAELAALAPDLMVVAAYGLILPPEVLAIPGLGCINVHASILPRWRGAAPIERAIEAGDPETGVTIMQMDEGLDTGDILLTRRCAISADETGASLRERLGSLGASALLDALGLLFAGALVPQAQDAALASYAKKLHREESLIDWQQDAATLERRIRAFNPMNPCHTRLTGQTLRVWHARTDQQIHSTLPGTIILSGRHGILVSCGSGALWLERLQLAGGKIMDAASLLNGRAELLRAGTRLGEEAP